MRCLALLSICFFAGGCGSLAKERELMDTAKREFAAQNYAACEAHADEAIRLNLTSFPNMELVEKAGGSLDLRLVANQFHARAHCRYGQGRVSEAVQDMETSVKYMAKSCQLCLVVERGRTCRQWAEDTETLAIWKKELAAQSKQEKP